MGAWQTRYRLTPGDPPNDGLLFADLEAQGRSGHMGHALVEYAPGQVLAFYPNCAGDDPRWRGHSGKGWMEYRRSTDGGDSWSDPIVLPHSKAVLEEGKGRSVMCEKAVRAPDGRIVAFYLNCDIVTNGEIWEPYFEPTYAFSHDGGQTWTQPRLFVHEAGRIYDALVRDGVIYVLFFANAELPGIAHLQEHPYRLYVSEDNGETFTLRSVLPFQSTIGCFYGTMAFDPQGRLLAYIYDERDEHNLPYLTSDDGGLTWATQRRAFFARKLRNPQLTFFGGGFFAHGRSGSHGEGRGHFVLYHSPDGEHWDEGAYLRMADAGAGAYSNSIVVGEGFEGAPKRLLIQTSHAYFENRTNTIMWWLDAHKEA